MQLILSTIAIAVLLILVSFISFPEGIKQIGNDLALTYFHPYVCSVIGLVSGLLIAAFTEYFTSHSYKPVRALADSCRAGAGSNVTLGLALGYFSTTIPVILIAVTAYIANKLMGYYGVSLAALGMLSNLPLSLAIDGYGPISDNAGGIAEMAEMGP
jgi:inorganic pyrophosphatase